MRLVVTVQVCAIILARMVVILDASMLVQVTADTDARELVLQLAGLDAQDVQVVQDALLARIHAQEPVILVVRVVVVGALAHATQAVTQDALVVQGHARDPARQNAVVLARGHVQEHAPVLVVAAARKGVVVSVRAVVSLTVLLIVILPAQVPVTVLQLH